SRLIQSLAVATEDRQSAVFGVLGPISGPAEQAAAAEAMRRQASRPTDREYPHRPHRAGSTRRRSRPPAGPELTWSRSAGTSALSTRDRRGRGGRPGTNSRDSRNTARRARNRETPLPRRPDRSSIRSESRRDDGSHRGGGSRREPHPRETHPRETHLR